MSYLIAKVVYIKIILNDSYFKRLHAQICFHWDFKKEIEAKHRVMSQRFAVAFFFRIQRGKITQGCFPKIPIHPSKSDLITSQFLVTITRGQIYHFYQSFVDYQSSCSFTIKKT